MPVSIHCHICGTFTVPGSSIVIDMIPGRPVEAVATCPSCHDLIHVGIREGLDVQRIMWCGARVRPATPLTPTYVEAVGGADWDQGAVEELMM